MKKVSSSHPFVFKVNSTDSIDLTGDPVIVSDEYAKIVSTRFGSMITVEDVEVEVPVVEATQTEVPKTEETIVPTTEEPQIG